eukprot:1508558-Prymnesium_polylepis.3
MPGSSAPFHGRETASGAGRPAQSGHCPCHAARRTARCRIQTRAALSNARCQHSVMRPAAARRRKVPWRTALQAVRRRRAQHLDPAVIHGELVGHPVLALPSVLNLVLHECAEREQIPFGQ